MQAVVAWLDGLHLGPRPAVGEQLDLRKPDVVAAGHEVDERVEAEVCFGVDNNEGDRVVAVAAGVAVALRPDATFHESNVHGLNPRCRLVPWWWLVDLLLDGSHWHSLEMDCERGSFRLRGRLPWRRGRRDPVVWRKSIESDNVGASIFA